MLECYPYISLLRNFEVAKVYCKVQCGVKGGKKDADVPFPVTTYNKYKNGVDLFDNYVDNYFTSIQGGDTGHFPLIVLKSTSSQLGKCLNYFPLIKYKVY